MADLQIRPMTVGLILRASFTVYRKKWGRLMAIAGVLILPYAVLYPVLAEPTPSLLMNPTIGELQDAMAALAPWLVVRLFIVSIMLAAVSRTAVETYVGMETPWRKQAAAAMSRMIGLAILSIVFWVAVLVGMVFFIVPGLYLLAAAGACLPVLMAEGASPVRALTRSLILTRGRRRKVLGVLFTSSVLVVLAELIGGLLLANLLAPPLGDFGLWVASELAWLAMQPFIGVVLGVMYLDLRVRKEDFDSGLLSLQLSSTAFDQ